MPQQLTLETWEQKAHRLALELREIRESQDPRPGGWSGQRARAFRKKKYELDMHIAKVTDER
jgi:hypothetical protein